MFLQWNVSGLDNKAKVSCSPHYKSSGRGIISSWGFFRNFMTMENGKLQKGWVSPNPLHPWREMCVCATKTQVKDVPKLSAPCSAHPHFQVKSYKTVKPLYNPLTQTLGVWLLSLSTCPWVLHCIVENSYASEDLEAGTFKLDYMFEIIHVSGGWCHRALFS